MNQEEKECLTLIDSATNRAITLFNTGYDFESARKVLQLEFEGISKLILVQVLGKAIVATGKHLPQ